MFPFDSGKQLVKTDVEYLNASTVVNIDMINRQRYFINMVQDITYLNVINPYDGAEIVICFAQDTTGGRVIINWLFTNEVGMTGGIDSTIIKPKDQDYTNLGLSLSAGIWDFIKITYINKKFCISKSDNF